MSNGNFKNGASRRGFMIGAGAAGLAMGAGPRAWAGPLDALKGDGHVVVCAWGGRYMDMMQQIWFDPFTDFSGVTVSTTAIPDMAKLEVMERVGNVEWDLVDTEGTQMHLAVEKGLLRPINYDLILSIVPEAQLDPKVMHEYGIGSVAFSTVIAWNTDVAGPDGPADWVEFFDESKFQGRRALYAQPRPSFEIALMAAGVPKDEIYPINIDDAFAALDAIRGKVDLWVEKTSQWGVLMQNGEVDLMGASLSRTLDEKNAGLPYDFHFNQSIVEQSYWTVPANAPGGDEAMKLIAWMMQAEGMLQYASEMPYVLANTSIYGDIPPEMEERLPGFPANAALNMHIDDTWWAANAQEVQVRWLDWMSRG